MRGMWALGCRCWPTTMLFTKIVKHRRKHNRAAGRQPRPHLIIQRLSTNLLTLRYENITTDRELLDFCDIIAGAPIIAFDTEFVSEDTYTPEPCLVQVSAAVRLAIIDPLEVPDLL